MRLLEQAGIERWTCRARTCSKASRSRGDIVNEGDRRDHRRGNAEITEELLEALLEAANIEQIETIYVNDSTAVRTSPTPCASTPRARASRRSSRSTA